jgi:uncharacterized membrane protein
VVRKVGISVAAMAVLIPLTAWVFAWPIERAVYLAPVILVGAAALIGLGILWGRVALTSLRESRRPRLVLGLWAAGIGLIVLLTILGVELPREGG